VVAPVAVVSWDRADALPDTGRGAGGFGHTGH
jgi:dUTPase